MKGKKKTKKNNKNLAVVCFLAIMFALTLGFAANSKNLDILNIGANVNPEAIDLDVIFDNDQTSGNALGVVKGTGTGADTSETGATITNPTTSNTAPTISGFNAKLTEKGQTVEYKFYVYNKSPYTAYLENVQFTSSTEGHKNCVALSPSATNPTLVSNACKDITFSLSVDGKTILSTGAATFESHSINVNSWKEVTIKIAYDGTQYPLPDGDMKVTFDGIRLIYTTLEQ